VSSFVPVPPGAPAGVPGMDGDARAAVKGFPGPSPGPLPALDSSGAFGYHGPGHGPAHHRPHHVRCRGRACGPFPRRAGTGPNDRGRACSVQSP
jgi:hypothetical protein